MNAIERPWEKLHELIPNTGTESLLSFFDEIEIGK